MRFMGHYRADQVFSDRPLASIEVLEKMGRLMQETSELDLQLPSDTLLPSDNLPPNSSGVCVKLSSGRVSVSGCRFAETKDKDIPCAMFEVESLAEAIQWTVSYLKVVGAGECDIRPLD